MKKQIVLLLLLFHFQIFSHPAFDSSYTDFSKDCSYDTRDVPEGGDAPLQCKPKFGYIAIITYSACMEFLRVVSLDGKENIDFPAQPIGSAEIRKLEWRVMKNKAVGIIYRTSVLRDDEEGNCPKALPGNETLEIRGLGKYSSFRETIPVKKKANEKAREGIEQYVKAQGSAKR